MFVTRIVQPGEARSYSVNRPRPSELQTIKPIRTISTCQLWKVIDSWPHVLRLVRLDIVAVVESGRGH